MTRAQGQGIALHFAVLSRDHRRFEAPPRPAWYERAAIDMSLNVWEQQNGREAERSAGNRFGYRVITKCIFGRSCADPGLKALLDEQRYRRQHFDADRKQAILVIAALGLANGLMLGNDLALLHSAPALGLILLCRLLFLVATAVAVVLLHRANRPRRQDQIAAGWLGVTNLLYLMMLTTRYPAGEFQGPLVGQLALIAALYFPQPGLIRLRAFWSAVTTAAVIVLLWNPLSNLSPTGRLTGTIVLILSNLAGYLLTAAFEKQRRLRFEAERLLAVKLRELAIEKKRAEATSHARAAFVAMMSHEFRTPMNAVIGLSDVLLDAPLGAEHRERVRLINESARALLGLLNNVLDFAAIDAQKISLSHAPFEPRLLVTSVAAVLRPAALARSLEFYADVSSTVPAVLVGDNARLRQVLLNLISNAIKFTERGAIRLSVTGREAMGGCDAGSNDQWDITVCVADTGIGITSEAIQRLFQPFTQVDGGSARRYKGTGLGLAISKQIILAMGGDIHVESEPGRGSAFSFTLRLAAAPAPEAAALPSLAGNPAAPLAILVADDDPISREVARAKLEQLDYTADMACDGPSAIEAALKRDYDVILMDLHMPGMSGAETTKHIGKRLAGRRTPHVIAMTASVLEEDHEVCRRVGMRGFVDKPIELAQLSTVLALVAAERNIAVPALSPKALAEIRHLREPHFFANLCAIFKTDARKRLSRMANALARGDARALQDDAHVLRSSSATMGATAMSELSGRIETEAALGQLNAIGTWLDTLARSLSEVEQALAEEQQG